MRHVSSRLSYQGHQNFWYVFSYISINGFIPVVISTPHCRSLNYNFLALVDRATATFHMTKPSQAPFYNNNAQFRNTQCFTNSCTAYSSMWFNSTHAYHASFTLLESVNHCLSGGPCFTTVKHGTAYASIMNPTFSPQCNILLLRVGCRSLYLCYAVLVLVITADS